jgi:hypothetical protein
MPAILAQFEFAAACPPAIAVAGLIALASGFRALRGTTLRAPWWWAAGSIVAVAASETAISLFDFDGTAGAAQLRLAVSSTTLLPVIALLGAKRPQDRAWQLIVLSFWVLFALPAAQAWLLRSESPPSMHWLWSCFLFLPAIFGATNYLPTRFWSAAILAAAGQIVLHWQYRPFASATGSHVFPPWGLGLLAAGAVVAALIARRRVAAGDPLDSLWIDFRNQFGAVWGLRIAERINSQAKQSGWQLTVGWHGFTTSDGGSIDSAGASVRPELEAALRTLLRRFISPEWIDRRLGTVEKPQDGLASEAAGVSPGGQT